MNNNKIISPFFILGLFILLINDFYLKNKYPGLITGKLSDIAGLFIFPFLFAVFFPSKKILIYLITLFGFILWKLPLSDYFINLWNNNISYNIDRVVDYTDYWALLILPFSYYYNPKSQFNYNGLFKKLLYFGIILISIFSFIATVGTHGNIKIYKFNYSKKEINYAVSILFEQKPELIVPEEYKKYTWHYTNTPPNEKTKYDKLNRMRADSVNFEFYIDDMDIIFWTSFVLSEEDWNKSSCRLAFISIITPGKKEKINDDLSSEEKKKYTSILEEKIIYNLKSILAKQDVHK